MRKKKKDITVSLARWTGRACSILMVLLMLAFVFDEGMPKLIKLTSPEIILFLAFFIMLGGYIVSWWKEITGAILIISGTVLFWSVNSVATGHLWMGWFIFVFPLSTLPLLFCWWKEK